MRTSTTAFCFKLLSAVVIASFLFSAVQPAATLAAPPPPTKQPLEVPDTLQPGGGTLTPPAPGFAERAGGEQQLAQDAIDRAVKKYLDYWGARYQVQPVQVSVEGEWARGVADWKSEYRVTSAALNILARRSPGGDWQAILPDGSDTFKQWLEKMPARLVSAGEKGAILVQSEEMQSKQQPGVLDVTVPPAVEPLPPAKPAPVGEREGQILKAPQEFLEKFKSRATPSLRPPESQPFLDEKTDAFSPLWNVYHNERWGYDVTYPGNWQAGIEITNPNDSPLNIIRERLLFKTSSDGEVMIEIWKKNTAVSLMDWISLYQKDVLRLGGVSIPNHTNAMIDGFEALSLTQVGDCSYPQLFKTYINAIDRILLIQYSIGDNGISLDAYRTLINTIQIVNRSIDSNQAQSLPGIENILPEMIIQPLATCEYTPNSAGCCGYGQVTHWQCSRDPVTKIDKGNCTYWAAYKRPDIGLAVGSGNAGQWAENAEGAGCSVSDSPQVGDIMVWENQGHVAYVTSVSSTQITVSEMNWCTTCPDSTETYQISGKRFIHSCGGGGGDTTDPTGGFNSPAENATITSGTVNISGWASDSGSGFDHAHFTAWWTGKAGYQISPDYTSSPFNFTWDLCGAGVPNGQQISLGLDIWDKAGNQMNSPGGNRHFYKNYTCGTTTTGNWKADYYDTIDRWNDNNNNGNFRCSETLSGPTLDHNYGTSGPCGMDGDYWVGDYSATINFPAGNYIFLSDHDDGMKIWLDGNNIGDYSRSESNNTCPARYLTGNHALRAMLREDGGDARIRLTWTTDTSVCNRPPNKPTLSSPGDYSEHTTNAPNLCWNNTSDPEGDTIQYYAEVYDSAVNANSGWTSSTCWRPSNLDGQYYNYQWRVRARDSRGAESDWSDTRHFTVKQATSAVPTLVSPANQSTVGRYDNVVLQWNTASNATQYYAEFWGGPSFNVNSGWISGTSWTVGSTFWGGKFQWRVRSRTSAGVQSDWSETRWLNRRYGTPGSLSSSNTGQSSTTLTWSASADAPGNISGYRIYRDGSAITTVGASTTTYTDTGVSCGQSYAYSVRAYQDDLDSASSNTVTVNTQTCPPADTTPPTVTWISPVANQENFYCSMGTIRLAAEATDNVGVSYVIFRWYNKLTSEWLDILYDYTPPYEVSVDCETFNLEWNTIRARPYDTAGNTVSEYIMLYREPPKPDLRPYQASDRSYPLTPSSITGTYTTSDVLFSNHPTYLDWLFINAGNAPAGAFHTEMWIDDTRYVNYGFTGLTNGYMYVFNDWAETIPTPGWHTLRMVVDATNEVDELDETNNVFEQDFYFTAHAPYVNDFEEQALEWDADGLWALTDTNQVSGQYSWWFGDAQAGGYNLGTVAGNLTTPPVYIPDSGYYLRFNYMYQTESRGPSFDQRWIQISVDGGDFENLYQIYDDGMNSWRMGPTLDLSAYANHTVQIRFRFDSIDNIDNDYLGWFIDDFTINTIAPPACPDTHEPNENADQATSLSIGGQVSGAICPNGDYDYYAFNAQAGDTIVADIDTDESSTLDPVLTLYGTDGRTVMTQNDDDGYTVDSKLGYVIPSAGRYYLKVRSYSHPSAGSDTSTYTLSLYTDPTDPDWAEFLSPTSGDWLDANSVTLNVDAYDGQSGITRVEFLWHSADWENGEWEWLGYDSYGWDGFTYTVDTSTLEEQYCGAYYAWAFDYTGKYASVGVWDLGIDRTPPETSMGIGLPYQGANFAYFYPYWDGTDNLSGIASFDVQVRDGAGAWTDLLTGTTGTSAYYLGETGHTYSFRMSAVDYAGNVRDYPAEPETSRTVTVCAASPDSAEANDTYPAARSFTPGNTLNLNFHAGGDEDWFYLDATAGRQYRLQTANTGGFSDTVLSLYGSDGQTLIDSNDDDAELNYASRLVWTAPQTGRYYLQVVHWNEDAYGCQTAYTLSVADITPNPLPEISSINPTSGLAGSGAVTLQVFGTNFVSQSTVRLNSADLATTYLSPTSLTAVMPASAFTSAGTAAVTVFNPEPGGGLSASRTFTINNPFPTISDLSPSRAEVGSGALNLTVNGASFVSTSVVQWNGTALATTFINATQIRAAVPANLLANTGSANVTVFNPAPGGGTSSAASFAINNPVPVLNSISPASGQVYGSGFTLTATGSKFVNGAVIQWNGESLLTTFVSSTSLTAAISADFLSSAGTATIRVVNPAPGGGNSGDRSFTISNPQPTLSGLSPNSVPAGGPDLTITVNGSNFVSTSRVLWNGGELVTTFINANQVTAVVPASNTANKSTATVAVRSPAPGGGTSGSQTFTLQADGKCVPYPVITCGGSDTRRNDAAGSTNRVDSYSCAPSWNESGPEMTYSFTAPADYNVTVGLTGLSVDLDLFILNNSSGECSGNNCLAAHENSASFVAQSGQTYYLVVDGASGATGSYTIGVNCSVNPLPAITSLSPASGLVNGPAFTLTVNGNNFINTSVVQWNGVDLVTTYSSSTRLTAAVPAANLAGVGTASVTVFNPAPGGGLSAPQTFTITNPVPALTSISPASALAGGGDFTMTLTGTGFVSSSVARWNGEDLPTSFSSSTTLTVQIPAERVALAGAASLTVFTPGPGGGTTSGRTFTINNPLPVLSSITPSQALAGDSGFTLDLTGSGFVPGSVARWNGTALTTTFVSPTLLQAAVPAANLAAAGAFPVTVFNPTPGGGASASQSFSVTNPVPVLSSIDPSSAEVYSSAFTLTLTGSNFVNGSRVRWNTTDLTTTFVSTTRLTASVPASLLLTGGAVKISAWNPTPGGGASGELDFTLNNPAPAITSLSPSSRLAGSTAFSLTVNGANFVNGSLLVWNGADLVTTFVSRTQLTASITAQMVAEAGTISILVRNPEPGGGSSPAAQFPITYPVPTLSGISPMSVVADSAGFTLTLTGSDFLPVSVVRWDDADLPTTYVSNTRLTAEVEADRLLNAGWIEIDVFNPEPGGGKSNTQNLVIRNPVPVLESINPEKTKAGSGAFDLTLTGSGFSSSAVVYWNGSSLTTTRVSVNELTARVPAYLVATPGLANVTVFQPTPGGGTSQILTFVTQPPTGSNCTAALTLDSAMVDTRRNDGPGSTDGVNGYGLTPWLEDGPEFVYAFTPATTGSVGLYLSGLSTNLDLFLIDGQLGACNSSEILNFGDKEIRFTAEAGHPYYIIVDGRSGAKGKYTLSVDNDNRAPASGTQLLNNRPLFNWEETPGATSYLLQFSTTDTFSKVLTSRTATKSISQSVTDLPKDRGLFWRVIPKFGTRQGTKSAVWSLQTANPPGTPTLVGPASGSLLRTLHPRLDWRNVTIPLYKTFGYYDVQISTDASFLNITANEQVAGTVENSEVTLAAELLPNTRYYWRVRAFTSDGHYSNWSAVRNFRTALLAPVLSEPNNGSQQVTQKPFFAWLPVGGATSYTLQISLSSTFSTTVINKSLTTTTFTPTTALRTDRTYYWRVRANGANGPSSWSEVWFFTTP